MARLLKVGATGFPTESAVDDANGIGIPVQSNKPSTNPATGYTNIYAKPDGLLYTLDSNGNEQPILPSVIVDMINTNLSYIKALATIIFNTGIPLPDDSLLNLVLGQSITYITAFGQSSSTTPGKTTYTLVDAPTISWDYSVSYNAQVTLGGNRILAIQNVSDGDYGTLDIYQDLTGSRTITLPAGSKVIGGGAGAVTLTTTAGALDSLSFKKNATGYLWTIGKNYT